MSTEGAEEQAHGAQDRVLSVALAAMGVVFGDIGTSPLYTIKEVFNGPHAVPVTPDNVLGILSLVFWALTVVVSLKYVVFIMRADNRGEGGIMALTSLALRANRSPWLGSAMAALGLFGAALFYGDGVITPAISVLSAVEGLEVATPAFQPYVLPISLMVLTGLFMIQRKGTAKVGAVFGPVMLFWFTTLGVPGAVNVLRHPAVLEAINPLYAVRYFADNQWHGFLALGAVVLAITGGEALYADMGHFGRRPIKLAWFGYVFPALYLNYLGQGALILDNPAAVANPFYRMVPEALVLPMVGLATLATIIASQAVISGAFSLTKQAMQLGYAPRMRVVHTSEKEIGQIYVPGVNWALLGAVVALVIGFHSSSALASAYGIAVTLTMMIDSVLAFVVVRALWRWGWLPSVAFLVVFFAVDFAFFSANSVKVIDGGWFPLAMGLGLHALLMTWKRGREALTVRMAQDTMPLELFIQSMFHDPPLRVHGTGVFMTTAPDGVPRALLHNLLHNKVLHSRVVLVNVVTEDVPFVAADERVSVEALDYGFYRVFVRYGFKDDPDIPAALAMGEQKGLPFELMESSFFLGRETLIARSGSVMARWRKRLFIVMFRNAHSAADFFGIPPNRVVEFGTQVEL